MQLVQDKAALKGNGKLGAGYQPNGEKQKQNPTAQQRSNSGSSESRDDIHGSPGKRWQWNQRRVQDTTEGRTKGIARRAIC
jgi:hypothetical protein